MNTDTTRRSFSQPERPDGWDGPFSVGRPRIAATFRAAARASAIAGTDLFEHVEASNVRQLAADCVRSDRLVPSIR